MSGPTTSITRIGRCTCRHRIRPGFPPRSLRLTRCRRSASSRTGWSGPATNSLRPSGNPSDGRGAGYTREHPVDLATMRGRRGWRRHWPARTRARRTRSARVGSDCTTGPQHVRDRGRRGWGMNSGRVGGETTRRTTTTCSSSPITRASRSRWRGTTFHFVTDGIERAKESADGQDVRLWGGAQVIQQYLAAGLRYCSGTALASLTTSGAPRSSLSRSARSRRPASRTSSTG
jgi:hypothetical protein